MADELIEVGGELPRVTSVRPLERRLVELGWADGTLTVVDLAPALASRRLYIPLRSDDGLFRTVKVSDFGDAIEWEGGLDFSADWLARLPSAFFDNASFRKVMDDLGLTLDGMAAQLEISRRMVARYRREAPIPRHIALATRYLAEHLPRTRDDATLANS